MVGHGHWQQARLGSSHHYLAERENGAASSFLIRAVGGPVGINSAPVSVFIDVCGF